MKSNLYDIQCENLQADMIESGGQDKTGNKMRRIDYYMQKTKGYELGIADIAQKAKGYEALRDESKKHNEILGFSVIILQLSVVLSSISALLKKKQIWYCSLALGIAGIVYFLNGMFLFF